MEFISKQLGNLTQIMRYIFESFELGNLAKIELFEAPFDFLSVLIIFKPIFLVLRIFKLKRSLKSSSLNQLNQFRFTKMFKTDSFVGKKKLRLYQNVWRAWSLIMPLCNRMFCCIFRWYFYIKIRLKHKKYFVVQL